MSSHRLKLRLGPKALVACTAAVAALGLMPIEAQADFTLARCGGADIKGRGASFQNNAQQGFIELFGGAQGCSGAPIIEPYDPAGSGAGRRSFGERSGTNTLGARDPIVRYAATDEGPNSTQQAQINSGPIDGNGQDVTVSDNGIVRVIPVAVGANVVAVNYPDGCTLPVALATGPNVPGTGVQDARLKLPAADYEKAFAAATTTWGALVPGISETPTGGRAAGACAAQQVKRIVRFDDSGTTYVQKAWLNEVNAARGWLAGALGANPNTTWPLGNGTNGPPTSVASGQQCNASLCSGSTNGNGALITLLAQTDGAIGYSDIRTARAGGFELNPTATANAQDTTYWVQIQNTKSLAYSEPTTDPNSFKPGGNPGANCSNVTFANIPADTTGDFSSATGASTPVGYPLCAPTYMLVWDDYAKVYGASDAEQAEARTVKDYLTMILGPVAQQSLALRDYQALPSQLLALAQGGSTLVNWNKGGSGVTPGPTPGATATATATPVASGTPVPTVVSNKFTITSARVSKKSAITVGLQLPGPGVVAVAAVAAKKGFEVGSATATAGSAYTLPITIKPSKKTKAALKKLSRKKKLAVKLSVSFTPSGGTVSTQEKTVSLKGTKKPKKPKKKKKK